MRLVATLIIALAATVLAGCGGTAKSSGPAWPAPSTTAEDGGESLEPRSTTVATSLEKSDDKADETKKPSPPADEPADKPAAATPDETPATVTPPTEPGDDEVIISDEIIIEIED